MHDNAVTFEDVMLNLSDRTKRRLAYGFWRYGEEDFEQATTMLSLARESGIDHLDTADVYGGRFGSCERMLGTLRKRAPSLFQGTVLATKAGCEPGSPYNSSSDYLKRACDASLSRLGVERIDLFYVHRPDLLAHPQELAETLDGLVGSGKVAAIGVSNLSVSQVSALAHHLRATIVAHQLEFSAGHVEPLFNGTLDQAMERGIEVAAWSPLARGRLGEDGPQELARVREVMATLAKKYGTTPSVIAVAFLLEHPAPVTPILGTKTPARLREALSALQVSLSRADWYALLEAARGERMP
jgi:predicted oxidoreductase